MICPCCRRALAPTLTLDFDTRVVSLAYVCLKTHGGCGGWSSVALPLPSWIGKWAWRKTSQVDHIESVL